MAKTATATKKVVTSSDVLRGNLQGSQLASARINQGKASSGGKKKGRAKKYLRIPPVGGWPGGHPDLNGKDRAETYRNKETMRLVETCNRHKIGGC